MYSFEEITSLRVTIELFLLGTSIPTAALLGIGASILTSVEARPRAISSARLVILLILTPIVVPILNAVGYSLVQFGIVMILNLGIGLLTPPVGAALYVGSAVSGIKIGTLTKNMLPFYALMVVTLLLLMFFPQLTTFML